MSIRGREGRLAATKFDLSDKAVDFIERHIGTEVPKNEWLRAYGSEVFVRIYPHPAHGTCFDIANVQIRQENQRQGIFRHFLAEVEKICWSSGVFWIKIENVNHPGLAQFLRKRGYTEFRDDAQVPSFRWNVNKGPPIV